MGIIQTGQVLQQVTKTGGSIQTGRFLGGITSYDERIRQGILGNIEAQKKAYQDEVDKIKAQNLEIERQNAEIERLNAELKAKYDSIIASIKDMNIEDYKTYYYTIPSDLRDLFESPQQIDSRLLIEKQERATDTHNAINTLIDKYQVEYNYWNNKYNSTSDPDIAYSYDQHRIEKEYHIEELTTALTYATGDYNKDDIINTAQQRASDRFTQNEQTIYYDNLKAIQEAKQIEEYKKQGLEPVYKNPLSINTKELVGFVTPEFKKSEEYSTWLGSFYKPIVGSSIISKNIPQTSLNLGLTPALLPIGEKLIYDKLGNVTGVESSIFKKSMSIEEYNKEVQRIQEVMPQQKYFNPETQQFFKTKQTPFKQFKGVTTTPIKIWTTKEGKPIKNIKEYLSINKIPINKETSILSMKEFKNILIGEPQTYDILRVPQEYKLYGSTSLFGASLQSGMVQPITAEDIATVSTGLYGFGRSIGAKAIITGIFKSGLKEGIKDISAKSLIKSSSISGQLLFSEPIARGTSKAISYVIPETTTGFGLKGIVPQVARGGLFLASTPVTGIAFGKEIGKGFLTQPIETGKGLGTYAWKNPYEFGTMILGGGAVKFGKGIITRISPEYKPIITSGLGEQTIKGVKSIAKKGKTFDIGIIPERGAKLEINPLKYAKENIENIPLSSTPKIPKVNLNQKIVLDIAKEQGDIIGGSFAQKVLLEKSRMPNDIDIISVNPKVTAKAIIERGTNLKISPHKVKGIEVIAITDKFGNKITDIVNIKGYKNLKPMFGYGNLKSTEVSGNRFLIAKDLLQKKVEILKDKTTSAEKRVKAIQDINYLTGGKLDINKATLSGPYGYTPKELMSYMGKTGTIAHSSTGLFGLFKKEVIVIDTMQQGYGLFGTPWDIPTKLAQTRVTRLGIDKASLKDLISGGATMEKPKPEIIIFENQKVGKVWKVPLKSSELEVNLLPKNIIAKIGIGGVTLIKGTRVPIKIAEVVKRTDVLSEGTIELLKKSDEGKLTTEQNKILIKKLSKETGINYLSKPIKPYYDPSRITSKAISIYQGLPKTKQVSESIISISPKSVSALSIIPIEVSTSVSPKVSKKKDISYYIDISPSKPISTNISPTKPSQPVYKPSPKKPSPYKPSPYKPSPPSPKYPSPTKPIPYYPSPKSPSPKYPSPYSPISVRTPPPPPIRYKQEYSKEKSKQINDILSKAFTILIRSKGKVREIGWNLPKGKALKLGVEKSKSNLAQTFALRESGTTRVSDITYRVPEYLFTQPKRRKTWITQETYVERRGKTLTEHPEVKGLQQAKKIKYKQLKWL